MEHNERFKKAEFAALVGVFGNVILAVFKAWIGIIANSRALIADAAHSASDIVGSFAVYIGLKAAKRPPDEDHPYGHGKAENIAAIIVAVLLLIVGFEIGKSSFQAFFKPIDPPKIIAIYAVIISIIAKEAMFQYKHRLGKRIKSDAIIVNAYEHRSDVYSSIAVLIGIAGAVFGGNIGIEWLVYLDPVAGIVVAIIIIKIAWKLGSESIHSTLDHVLHEEDTEKFRVIVQSVPEVMKIDSLHAREHGHYVIIDLKISVNPYITVEAGHLIGKKVKARLLESKEVQDVFVHINPYSEQVT
ncbi:cation diffusion facilitator family transporter [Sutcliffiella rhizosphaerae]|nr:cation diffusion facilitator family transporter [Sutcliffiella rhizosphaerae]